MKKNIHILLVEDSEVQALQIQYLLKEKGYTVDTVTSGEEAMEYLESYKPRIVVSDVIMPGMDGYELCSRIKSVDKNIRVILLTTLSLPEDIIKGLACGADNFITKPFQVEYLYSHINYILNKCDGKNDEENCIEIFFAGKKHLITSEKRQILGLLFSAIESKEHSRDFSRDSHQDILQKAQELEQINKELKKALEKIKTLRGLLPVCSYCKKIRNDDDYWQKVNAYIQKNSGTYFSHSLCPACLNEFYADFK